MNRMVGEKVAIVTAKPQTTRTRITGILTRGAVQYVFLDTPGIHRPRTRLGERMAKATADSVAEVDAVVMLFEPYGELTEAEQALVEDIRVKKVPALAAVNKTDTLKKETDLAVRMQFLEKLGVFRGVLPLCVSEDRGCTELLDALLPFAVERRLGSSRRRTGPPTVGASFWPWRNIRPRRPKSAALSRRTI